MESDHTNEKRMHVRGGSPNGQLEYILAEALSRTVSVFMGHHENNSTRRVTLLPVDEGNKLRLFHWQKEDEFRGYWQSHCPFECALLCSCDRPARESQVNPSVACTGTDRTTGMACATRMHIACVADDEKDNASFLCVRCRDGADRELSAVETESVSLLFKCDRCPYRANKLDTFRLHKRSHNGSRPTRTLSPFNPYVNNILNDNNDGDDDDDDNDDDDDERAAQEAKAAAAAEAARGNGGGRGGTGGAGGGGSVGGKKKGRGNKKNGQ